MSQILKIKEERNTTIIPKFDIIKNIVIHQNKNSKLTTNLGVCESRCINCINPRCIYIDPLKNEFTSFKNFTHNPNREICPVSAIEINDSEISINYNKCINCGLCAVACPLGAIIYKDGYFQINKFNSNDSYFEIFPINDKSHLKQELFIKNSVPSEKKGSFLLESNKIFENLYDNIKILPQDKQNIFVRNLLILLDNNASITRKGNVYLRFDGYYENNYQYGVFEIEIGNDMLETIRAILDDIAVMHSRYNINKINNKALVICLGLPNKRQDYWMVVKDIRSIIGIEVQTITIGSLLLLLWNNCKLNSIINEFYIDIDNYSIRNQIESKLNRTINIDTGQLGILEIEK